MVIIFCWLALLAAIGLAAASYLSFPVAAFASMAVLLMGFPAERSRRWWSRGPLSGYDPAKGGYGHSPVDLSSVPVFQWRAQDHQVGGRLFAD